MLLAKSKLSNIEVFISKASIDSVISHDKFVLIYKVLKEYDKMKEVIKKFKELNSSLKILILYKIMLSYFLKCRKNTESKNPKAARIKHGIIMLL